MVPKKLTFCILVGLMFLGAAAPVYGTGPEIQNAAKRDAFGPPLEENDQNTKQNGRSRGRDRLARHIMFGQPLGGVTSNAPFALPVGVWEGYVSNPNYGDIPCVPPPAPPYWTVLEITNPSFNPWDPVGNITYGIGTVMFAPVFGFWPMECVDYMAGEFPNGQCFQFTESFREEISIGDPIAGRGDGFFAYGDFTLSFQEDGSVFYMYLNGNFGVTYTVLNRRMDLLPPPLAGPQECTPLFQPCDISLQWSQSDCCNNGPCVSFPPYEANQGFCHLPGQKFGIAIDFLTPGTFEGRVRALAPQFTAKMLPEMDDFDLTLNFPDTSCTWWNENCGESVWTLGDGTLLAGADNLIFARIECRDSFAGNDPAGQCWQICHYLLNENLEDPVADPVYAMISMQKDGSLFWSMQQGMLINAQGHLQDMGNSKDGLSGVIIAGIAIGCLCGVVVLAAGAVLATRKAAEPSDDGLNKDGFEEGSTHQLCSRLLK